MKNKAARRARGSVLYSAQNCRERKSLTESHNGLEKEEAANTKHRAASGLVFRKATAHKRSAGQLSLD